MLKRVENVQAYYQRDLTGLLSGNHRLGLQIGRKEHLTSTRIDRATFLAMAEESAHTPVLYATIGERAYWRYQDKWFSDNDGLSADQVRALLESRTQRRQATINRALTMTSRPEHAATTQRQRIPDHVRMQVWTRDQGSCARCGATNELQIDHIVPVAAGGSSDPVNLQVLCGPCNRLKGASVV